MSLESRQDIGALIDDSRLSRQQASVIVLCGLVVLLDGFDLQTMALAVPSLMQEWSLGPAAFSYALSGALLGMVAGTCLVAPLGDKVGRRPVLIAGMAIVGAASIATAFSSTPAELFVWRFLTGIGLGMSMPNATALTSEYVPLKSRVFLISLMFCGVALGALIAGFTAPALIGAFGWRSIFLVGGVVPLFIAAALYVWIPESLRLLVAQRPADPRIASIVARFLPGVEAATVVASASDRVERQNVLELFAPRYRARTALLWAAFALNLFVLFVLISWLPAVLTAAGWTPAQALRGAVVNQAGGIVGGLVIAWLVDRDKTVPALIGGYVLVAAALSLFLVVPSNVTSWVVLLVVVGAGISGAQVALNALSAVFYPPSLRANGAGWANTIGRTGALLAPLAGGFVIARFTLEPAQQLTLLIAPVLLCGACAALLPYVWRGERPASAGAIGAQRSAAEPLG